MVRKLVTFWVIKCWQNKTGSWALGGCRGEADAGQVWYPSPGVPQSRGKEAAIKTHGNSTGRQNPHCPERGAGATVGAQKTHWGQGGSGKALGSGAAAQKCGQEETASGGAPRSRDGRAAALEPGQGGSLSQGSRKRGRRWGRRGGGREKKQSTGPAEWMGWREVRREWGLGAEHRRRQGAGVHATSSFRSHGRQMSGLHRVPWLHRLQRQCRPGSWQGRVFTRPTGLKTVHTNPSAVDGGCPLLSRTLTLSCRRTNLRSEKTCQEESAGLWPGVPAGWRPPRVRPRAHLSLEPRCPHLSTVGADHTLYHIQGLWAWGSHNGVWGLGAPETLPEALHWENPSRINSTALRGCSHFRTLARVRWGAPQVPVSQHSRKEAALWSQLSSMKADSEGRCKNRTRRCPSQKLFGLEKYSWFSQLYC